MDRFALSLAVLSLAVACGGRSQDTEQGSGGKGASGGKGGSGSGATGGSTGGSGTGAEGGSVFTGGTGTGAEGGTAATGGAGGSTGGTGCCLAFPTCPEGEEQISGPEGCPPELPGSTCHEVTICCSTIWCATPGAGTGGTGAGGSAAGGSGGSGGTPACSPEDEYNRDYVGLGEQCLLIDFFCADPTFNFYDECGCGCEQDAACPPAFNCEPNAKVGMLPCTPENLARCPFSERLE